MKCRLEFLFGEGTLQVHPHDAEWCSAAVILEHLQVLRFHTAGSRGSIDWKRINPAKPRLRRSLADRATAVTRHVSSTFEHVVFIPVLFTDEKESV